MLKLFKTQKALLLVITIIVILITSNLGVWAEDFSTQVTFNMSLLTPRQILTANATATNLSSNSEDILLILALYDPNGTMVSYACMPKNVPYQGVETFSAGLKLPSVVTGYKARVLIWGGTDIQTSNMIPLSNVVEISS